jgi:hypothetical protein
VFVSEGIRNRRPHIELLAPEVYDQLRHSHPSTERGHLHIRSRYTQGGKDSVMRNKRFGIECQQLRAAGILFLEWFRLCLRHGWLGSHKKLNEAAASLRRAGRRLATVLDTRKRHALDLPYGESARRARLAGEWDPAAHQAQDGHRLLAAPWRPRGSAPGPRCGAGARPEAPRAPDWTS